MPTAKLIDQDLFERVARDAAASDRRRMNFNFHESAADNPHRFLNVLLKGTYVRPHRHSDPPKSESFLVLEGAAEVILFNDHGAITERYLLSPGGGVGQVWGVDLPPGVWHTILPLTDRAVCFEVKPGPWEAASDKEFASWAPPDNHASVQSFLTSLTSSNRVLSLTDLSG